MNNEYQNYELHTGTPDFDEFYKSTIALNQLFLEYLPLNKDAKILEIGSGHGQVLYWLQTNGYSNLKGIDLCEDAVRFCNDYLGKVSEVYDAFDFLEKGEKCDMIIMNHVLEHFNKEDCFKILKLCNESLNDKGRILIQVPNISNPFSLNSQYRDFTHKTAFTEDTLRDILYMSGFRNVYLFDKIVYGSFKGIIKKIITSVTYPLLRLFIYSLGYTPAKHLKPKLFVVGIKDGKEKKVNNCLTERR